MSQMRFPSPAEREKRARLLELLDTGKVLVYLDPRRPGVDLPAHLMGEMTVPLNLSHRFGLPVFDIGPHEVRASLSFGGDRHLCVLPYSAIFGLFAHADGTRVVFADALPPEVALIAERASRAEDRQAPRGDGRDAAAPEDAPGTQLDSSAPPEAAAEPDSTPPRRPSLRLVD